MLITLIKGILIGMIISAPLGPVGVLCLRETIHGGRREGLLTGLGAMLSDVLYSFIVYLGVGLVLDFVLRYDAHLRVIGGIIIVAFAAHLYYKSRGKIKQTPTQRLSKIHGLRKALTAFFVTLANPFIMLLILPLYTRFQFVRETSTPGLELTIALVGIALGCMLWWYILTGIIRYVTSRTGDNSIHIVSRIIAIILGTIGLIGIYTGIEALTQEEPTPSSKMIKLQEYRKASISNTNNLK